MDRKTLGMIVCGIAVACMLVGILAGSVAMFWLGAAVVAGWFIGLRRVKTSEAPQPRQE